MARRLNETENAAASVAVAMPEDTARTVPADELSGKRNWKPYINNAELPPAKFVMKTRTRTFIRGGIAQMEEFQEKVFTAPGDGRYKVTSNGELIKVYRKRGGTGTRLIHKFKHYDMNYPEAKELNKRNDILRAQLRKAGIPGA